MTYDPDDTIAAIGTAAGGAVRGMVRLSGPQVLDCLVTCFTPREPNLELSGLNEPNVLVGSIAVDGPQSAAIPCDLFLWPSSRSYTRQPTAELHTLGSPPLLKKLLDLVCEQGARLAEPGEFTLRAFLAGRLDLTQAEAVLGVIDAHSMTDLDTALAQLAGGLSQPLAQLREQLLRLLAELEAGLDFAEEDIEFISKSVLQKQLNTAQAIIAEVVAQLSSRVEVNDLPRVVLSGPPNAGKSSLFNALVERFGSTLSCSQALVSTQSGTTRDFVTATIEVHGIACELVDTAGVESIQADDSIDGMAQVITGQQCQQASLVVRCRDASCNDQESVAEQPTRKIIAMTKSDLVSTATAYTVNQVACSSLSGEGLEELALRINGELSSTASDTERSLSNTATRCTESLRKAEASLIRAQRLSANEGGEELIASELRATLHALGQVVGVVYTDDILDRIFSQFCIGK